jgi:hypothetical protein
MTDEQTAAAIVADYRNACDETAMEAAIVRALQAARGEAGRDGVVAGHMTRKAPVGHIIDEAGVVRRIAASGVYGQWPSDEVLAADTSRCTHVLWIEAAEAAKEGKA